MIADNAEERVSAVCELLTDYARAELLAVNALRHVQEHCSWECFLAQCHPRRASLPYAGPNDEAVRALAADDRDNVGMTLLAIDEEIDTGPVYGYYRYAFGARRESRVRIQQRVFLENADAIRHRMITLFEGNQTPLQVNSVPSRNWGQPWLTAHQSYQRWLRGVA